MTAYGMRICDWSSYVCSSDRLRVEIADRGNRGRTEERRREHIARAGDAAQRVIARPLKPPLGEHRHVVLTLQILPQILGALPAACDACDDAGTGLVRLCLGPIDQLEKGPHRGVWIRPEQHQRSKALGSEKHRGG